MQWLKLFHIGTEMGYITGVLVRKTITVSKMASSGLTSERHAHFQLPTAARIAHILSFSGSYRESVGSRVQVVLETHKLKILPYQEQGNAMHVVRRGKYIIKVPLE